MVILLILHQYFQFSSYTDHKTHSNYDRSIRVNLQYCVDNLLIFTFLKEKTCHYQVGTASFQLCRPKHIKEQNSHAFQIVAKQASQLSFSSSRF